MSELPRRRIEEVVVRWHLSRLKTVIVEGDADKRFFDLLSDGPCSKLASLDFWVVDIVEVPPALLHAAELSGGGNKNRVIAFSKMMERDGLVDGFRGVVDRDVDQLVDVNHESPAVLYTDYGCMDAYAWTIDTLRTSIVHFKCETNIRRGAQTSAVFESINAACSDLAAVRAVNVAHPDLQLSLHCSEAALNLTANRVGLDLDRYLEQCKPAKGRFGEARRHVEDMKARTREIDSLMIINGHDLVWLLTYVLRRSTLGPRRLVEAEQVAAALLTSGLSIPELPTNGLFMNLTDWAA